MVKQWYESTRKPQISGTKVLETLLLLQEELKRLISDADGEKAVGRRNKKFDRVRELEAQVMSHADVC